MTDIIDDLSYRQARCPHGWVERTQCESCATALERDKALLEIESLQADHTDEVMRGLMLEKAHAVILADRDSALARLAEIEAQEPTFEVQREDEKNLEWLATLPAGTNLYAAAGASPQTVQPSQAQNPKLTMGEWMAHARNHRWRFDEEQVIGVGASPQPAQPSSARGLSDTALLDYLIAERGYVVSDVSCADGYWLNYSRPDGSIWVQITEHETPRAAIIAAINARGDV